MKKVVAAAVLAIACSPVWGQSKADPCAESERWLLPPNKSGARAEQFVVLNAPQAVRVRLCNCTDKQPDSYVIINAYGAGAKPAPPGQKKARRSGDLPDTNYVGWLFAGSCMEAGGTAIKVFNPGESKGASGTYVVR